jgi:hypothetical protein
VFFNGKLVYLVFRSLPSDRIISLTPSKLLLAIDSEFSPMRMTIPMGYDQKLKSCM